MEVITSKAISQRRATKHLSTFIATQSPVLQELEQSKAIKDDVVVYLRTLEAAMQHHSQKTE